MAFARCKALGKQKVTLEKERDCADTHHGVSSGAGQGSIEQRWTSRAVEFSAAVEDTGRGWLMLMVVFWVGEEPDVVMVGVSFHRIMRLRLKYHP